MLLPLNSLVIPQTTTEFVTTELDGGFESLQPIQMASADLPEIEFEKLVQLCMPIETQLELPPAEETLPDLSLLELEAESAPEFLDSQMLISASERPLELAETGGMITRDHPPVTLKLNEFKPIEKKNPQFTEASQIDVQKKTSSEPVDCVETDTEFAESMLSVEEVDKSKLPEVQQLQDSHDNEQNIQQHVEPDLKVDIEQMSWTQEQTVQTPEITRTDAPEPAKVVNKVVHQVVEEAMAQLSVSQKNDTTVTVRLDPPELGKVLVRLKKTEGGIVMRVAAMDQGTQQLLQDHEHVLSESLETEQQNLSMELGSEADFSHSELFDQQEVFDDFKHRRISHSIQVEQQTASTLRESSLHDFTA